MIKKIAAILCIGLCTFSCKQKSESPNAKLEKAKEALEKSPNLNKGDGTYSISAPEGWKKEENKDKGVHSTIIFSPLENVKDNFKDNVNVVTEKIPAGYTLEQYQNTSLQNISKYLTNFKEIDRGSTLINGMPAKVINYNHSMQGYDFDVMVFLLLENNIAYVITCSTKKGDMEKYRADFQSIANTFKIN